MSEVTKNPVLGFGTCHVCEHFGRDGQIQFKLNRNGRFYSHCQNSVCRTEIRYEIDESVRCEEVEGLPRYVGKKPNVKKPRQETEPNVKHKNDNVKEDAPNDDKLVQGKRRGHNLGYLDISRYGN